MDGTQVGILEETYKVRFGSLLERQHSRALKPKIRFEILSNLTDETLEGQFADEKVSRLLVPANLTKSDSSRTVAVRLLYTASRRGRLASSLRGKLLARCLTTGGLARSL